MSFFFNKHSNDNNELNLIYILFIKKTATREVTKQQYNEVGQK